MPDTIRQRLVAIIERNAPTRPHHNPGDDYRDAVAALDLLENASRVDGGPLQHALERYRLVPDPEPSDA